MLEARHGKEIDARITKWSDELTARWEKTKEEVETLTRAQEGEKAVETLREALVYGEGDGAIERQAGQRLEALQAFTAVQATSAERDASSGAPEEGAEQPADAGAGAEKDAGEAKDAPPPEAPPSEQGSPGGEDSGSK
jgi:hypothetical protein